MSAASAQGAEGPFYKVEGVRLNGKKTVTAKAVAMTEYVFKVKSGEEPTTKCKEMSFMEGASITGLNTKTSDVGEGIVVFKMCTVEKNGANCAVANQGTIKSEELTSTLAYGESGRKGKVVVAFRGKFNSTIAHVQYEGANCIVKEGLLEGSFAGETLDSGNKSIVAEGMPSEGFTNFLKFTTGQIGEVWTETSGVEKKETIKLSFSIAGFPFVTTITGDSELTLNPAEKWSMFTK
jgi:hypothetical protein